MVLAMTQRRTSSPKHLTVPTRPFMAGETSEQGRSMPRRIGESWTMIFRIGRGHCRSRNGDFGADKARYRGLASVALTTLTRPSEAMADAAYQAVSLTATGLLTAEAISRRLRRR
jgi:hypothetical protein